MSCYGFLVLLLVIDNPKHINRRSLEVDLRRCGCLCPSSTGTRSPLQREYETIGQFLSGTELSSRFPLIFFCKICFSHLPLSPHPSQLIQEQLNSSIGTRTLCFFFFLALDITSRLNFFSQINRLAEPSHEPLTSIWKMNKPPRKFGERFLSSHYERAP
jgi:hypothetical protein